MTVEKLKEKLSKLGYEEINILTNHYVKRFCIGVLIHITFTENNKCLGYVKELPLYMFETQRDIDNLQKAFTQLQQDLEVLNNA